MYVRPIAQKVSCSSSKNQYWAFQFMARKTKKESLETRQDILTAAARVFSTQGVAKTSLNDIAKEAGVTRGAIYWHFENKTDLFNELWMALESDINDVEYHFSGLYPDDPLKVVRATTIYVLQVVVTDPKHRTLLEILFHKCEFVGELVPIIEARQLQHLAGFDKIERNLYRCVLVGQLPRDLNTRIAAITLRSYVAGLIDNWLFMPEGFDLYSLAEDLVDGFLDMLINSPHLRIKIDKAREVNDQLA